MSAARPRRIRSASSRVTSAMASSNPASASCSTGRGPRRRRRPGVEPGPEAGEQRRRRLGVGDQVLLDVPRRVRRAELTAVAAVGPQDRELAPGQVGEEHQTGERVDLGVAEPAGEDRVGGTVPPRLGGQLLDGVLGDADAEVVEVELRTAEQLVRHLLDDGQAERLEHREERRQLERAAPVDHPQPPPVGQVRVLGLARGRIRLPVGRQLTVPVEDPGDEAQVLDRAVGLHAVAVGAGQPPGDVADEPGGLVDARRSR
jgi:hypothetical protein